MRRLICSIALVLAATAVAQAKTRNTYWDKGWGIEKGAMQAVVDDFNASQERIYVEFVAVSDIIQKVLLATAAGIPPDLAGMWAANVIEYADKNALMPLDEMARGTNVTRDRYL